MIKISNVDIHGFGAAIRGMRNSYASWDKSDSRFTDDWGTKEWDHIGKEDLNLMTNLGKAGSSHSKYRRFITVTCNILAPLYWWKQFDQYKVGTVTNSTSTMHSVCDKEFKLDDFSTDRLRVIDLSTIAGMQPVIAVDSLARLKDDIYVLNLLRKAYLHYKFSSPDHAEEIRYQIIARLPGCYNQLRTVQLNYEVLSHMIHDRTGHKLAEWNFLIEWAKTLPLPEVLV